jgi:FAD/FMN-containing dehydrogenase/Fe-S oxidoreductase
MSSDAANHDLGRALDGALAGEVRHDAFARHLYARDASMYAIEPLAVAFPQDAADVAAAIEVAGAFGVSVLPRGAGTSLAGQTVGHSVVLDLSRHLDRIEELDPEARVARVQPGVVQDDLNAAAAAHGLMFGADTSTSNRATLGGMIGNNSAGSSSIRYGMTIDHVQAVDVVLSDASAARFEPMSREQAARVGAEGSLERVLYRGVAGIVDAHGEAIVRDSPPFWRHAGGYRLDRVARQAESVDLTPLLVGSEGTLAIVTEARVGLVPKPAAQAIAVGHFRSTAQAIAATHDALELGAATVELLDRTILDLSRTRQAYAALSRLLVDDPDALLFVGFVGDSSHEAADAVEKLSRRWARNGHGYYTLVAKTSDHQVALLRVRKASLGLLMAASTGTRRPLAFVEDTAVPPERLVEYVAAFTEILDRRGLRAGIYGHCSVGCLHIRPFIDLRANGEIDVMRAVAEEVLELVVGFGGVNSSEHGDGLVRSEFNRRLFGEEVYGAMLEVKRLFDPQSRLNPGKIVDSPPLTENLRDAQLPAARPLTTFLRFGVPDGMRGAADRCMNIGACRKTDSGVMCPSYMATRDEEDSTRGRANALIKALSAPDPAFALGDERLHGILDLCLQCKACKSECPLGVDMASLKSEFLAQYQRRHGVPTRSRAFGSIRTLNRIGSATAPIANLAVRSRIARSILDDRLGIASRRPLPRFEQDSLVRWHRRRRFAPGPRGEIVLLADSFTTYTEPSVGRAAVEVLERGGWRVKLESRGCCGRASISKGLLERARSQATTMVERLAPYARQGIPIVGCEPSCVLTLRDEYLSLLPEDRDAGIVAEHVRPLAELVSQAIDDGSLVFAGPPPLPRRIVFHGHCHERALLGNQPMCAMLSRIPGTDVVELDAGCCGMAGSFGFESEHYELSMKIGSLRLFPALEAEASDTLIAASGVSCRQQIAHGTGRRARHPIELVRAAMGP